MVFKKVANFVVSCGLSARQDIFVDESVIAFILEWKSGKFQLSKDSNHTRHSVLVTIMAAFLPHTPIRVWGIVYLLKGFPEPPFR